MQKPVKVYRSYGNNLFNKLWITITSHGTDAV